MMQAIWRDSGVRAQAVNGRLLAAALGLSAAVHAWPGEEPSAPDLDGKDRRPCTDAKAAGQKAAVFIFVTHECPIANAYAPEIERIRAEYQPKGCAFYLVHVDGEVSAEAARNHAREYGHKSTILIDREHRWVAHAEVKTAPEAAVFQADGARVYRGRIDDRFAAPRKDRVEPATRELRAALDAVLAGTTVPKAETESVGCPIAPLKRAAAPAAPAPPAATDEKSKESKP